MNVVYVLPGAAVAMIGFVLFFALLASRDALSKSKQLAALGEVASGRAGAGAVVWLIVAVVLMGFGACGAFVGVGMSDRERAKACTATCKARGYAKARIRASTARHPTRPKAAAFVACACEGGPTPDPLELRADGLSK